jgi:NAD-dependent dihydropyrimidine dehydrogenase PreA subunit
MEKAQLYEALAKHLDQNIIGAPFSPAFKGILEILFPQEEAEVALKLPFENKTILQLQELYPEKADALEDILQRMVSMGTVFTSQSAGKERVYCLLPTVVGFAETPFWAGKDTPMARRLAPLWRQYCDEAFNNELARGTPVMRVIPIETSLKDNSQILPFDVIKEKLDKVTYCAVAQCPCRQMSRLSGEGCDHSLENCLHFDSMGRFIVEQSMGREITKEEALKILREADAEGLVHACDNINGYMSTICNCCGCCCVFLIAVKRGLNAMSPSNYVAKVDVDICVGCSTCEERCPMDAVKVGEDDVASVDPSTCIGCGSCTSTCATGAIGLIRRETIKLPLDIGEIFTLRMGGK